MTDSRAGAVFYRIAMLCGVLPIILLISSYLLLEGHGLWFVSGFGFSSVYKGIALFLALGCVSLIVYVSKRRSETRESPDTIARRSMKPFGLLLLNIPVCAIVVILAANNVTMTYSYTVVLDNKGKDAITRFEVEAPGVERLITNTAPGESNEVHLRFRGDSVLTYRAEVGNKIVEGAIEGYSNGAGEGGKSVVTFSDGVFSTKQTEWGF